MNKQEPQMIFMTAAEEKKKYKDLWAHNAQSLEAQGAYSWMASQLDVIAPRKILDIGCGTGEGLLELYKRFQCQIVCVDENAECLRSCAQKLKRAGIRVQLVERFRYEQIEGGKHYIDVGLDKIRADATVVLVQGDILFDNDARLFQYLSMCAPFDAVTIWLMGVYKMRQSCENLAPLKIEHPEQYRLLVQCDVYGLAAELLRPGGIMQTVERGEAHETSEFTEHTVSCHREQADPSIMRVSSMKFMHYQEIQGKGIRVVFNAKEGATPVQPALISVLSEKPIK